MHLTNLPQVASSLTFLIPYFAAVETDNLISAVLWGTLATTSVLLHITKKPYHLHGPGNCLPYLYELDQIVLYATGARATYDGLYGNLPTAIMVPVFIWIVYHTLGYPFKRDVEFSIYSHTTIHLIGALGGTAVLYGRAFKNGQESS